MCGRYRLPRDPLDGMRSSIPETMPGFRDPFTPRYNIAPSEPQMPATSKRKTPARPTTRLCSRSRSSRCRRTR